MNARHFIQFAGSAAYETEIARQVAGGVDLCAAQEDLSALGYRGLELVRTATDWSLRFDSGLQGWSIYARAQGFADAVEQARAWVAADELRRRAWVRVAAFSRETGADAMKFLKDNEVEL